MPNFYRKTNEYTHSTSWCIKAIVSLLKLSCYRHKQQHKTMVNLISRAIILFPATDVRAASSQSITLYVLLLPPPPTSQGIQGIDTCLGLSINQTERSMSISCRHSTPTHTPKHAYKTCLAELSFYINFPVLAAISYSPA